MITGWPQNEIYIYIYITTKESEKEEPVLFREGGLPLSGMKNTNTARQPDAVAQTD